MIRDALRLRRLRQAERLPPDALARLAEQRLRAIVRHAHDQVPYWRELMRSAGAVPDDIRTLADLARLPVTTKAALRDAGADASMPSSREPPGCIVVRTSGSTGLPFAVRVSPAELDVRRLVNFRAMLAAGVRRDDVVVIAGPEYPREKRWHHRLPWYRTWMLSGTTPAGELVPAIRRLQPSVLWIYPTVLRALMDETGDRLERVCTPRMLINSSEALEPALRARLDPSIEVFDFYGTSEVGRIAQECPAHAGLHVNADQAIVETVPREPGEPREVLVTSLGMRVTPFLRYRLDDLAEPVAGPCACGSPFPRIGAIEGRHWDPIRLPSGRSVSPIVLAVVMRRSDAIGQYRAVQVAPDRLVMELVPGPAFRRDGLPALEAALRGALGEPVAIDFRLVTTLDAPPGTYRNFESRLGESSRDPSAR